MSPLTPEERARARNEYCTVADDCRHHPVTISFKYGEQFCCDDCGEPLNEEAWYPPTEWTKVLASALVRDDHRLLYHNSAAFKATIDMLVQTLPVWVDALAEQATKADEEMRVRAQELARQKPVVFLPEEKS